MKRNDLAAHDSRARETIFRFGSLFVVYIGLQIFRSTSFFFRESEKFQTTEKNHFVIEIALLLDTAKCTAPIDVKTKELTDLISPCRSCDSSTTLL
jgi:hypothetical protein